MDDKGRVLSSAVRALAVERRILLCRVLARGSIEDTLGAMSSEDPRVFWMKVAVMSDSPREAKGRMASPVRRARYATREG